MDRQTVSVKKYLAAFLLLCMSLTIITVGATAEAQVQPQGDPVCYDTEEYTDYYINAVNAWRVWNGLNTLIIAPSLNAAALTHTQFIAEEHALIHGNYDQLWQGAVNGAYYVGENLVMGSARHPEGTEAGFQALVNSPGHNENMLNPDFTHIGVGTCTRGPWQYSTHRFMASWIVQVPSPPATEPDPVATPPPATATATPSPTVEIEEPTAPTYGVLEPRFVG